MSQNKKISIIILAVLLIIAGGVFLSMKLGQNSSSVVNKLDQERYSTEPTGIDLIQKALDDKKIDYDTALIYKVQFLFNDPTLSKEYFTKNAPFEDSGVFTEIKESWSKLSAETKKALEPYFKRPDDPESYISKVINGEIEVEKISLFKFVDEAWARERPFSYKSEDILNTSDGKIKVWYLEKKEVVAGQEKITKLYYETAKQIVANLNTDGAYAQYVGLLGKVPPSDGTFGGDEKTDIYIVPVGFNALLNTDGSSCLGVNSPDNGSGSSSFILLRENLTPNILKTTTVHELFHAFQRAFGWCWQTKKDLWWIEGTATWSEDFIYPKLNTEQGYVHSFIPKPDSSLDSYDDNFEYGAYVFPFYLSNTYDRGVITKVFETCSQSSATIKSVETVIDGGFKKNWKEFTLWNYNKKPIEYYKEKDQSKKFTTDSSESGGNVEGNFITGLGEVSYPTKELSPLTSQILTFSVSAQEGEDIRKVIFQGLKDFTSKNENGAIKAVIYPKSGEPYTEDWTDRDRRAFCFDKSDENFEKLVLIFSNADIKNKISVSEIKEKALDSCFEISQGETMTVNPIFAVTPGYVGTLKYQAEGELVKNSVPASANFAYLGKWKVKVNYLEKFPPQRVMWSVASKVDLAYDHLLEFDLSAESVLKDGTFEANTAQGNFQTPGWSVTNEINGATVAIPQNVTAWDVKQKGVISEMTEDGCKISLPEFVLYNSGGYRNLPHPIVFEIKKD